MRSTRSLTVLLLTLVSLIASACGSDTSSAQAAVSGETTTTTVLTDTTTSEPVETTTAVVDTEPPTPAFDLAGFTDEVTAVLEAWQEANGAPAVSLSVRLPGQEPVNVASGVGDLTTEEPVTADSFFRIGSITKPMTAAVILQLADEGLVDLDVPVRDYLPDWLEGYPYADEITIRQLMNHTNGLKEYALDPVFYSIAGQRLDTAMEPEEIIEWLAEQEPLFAPGAQYSYETGGFLTLGRVIEAVTGNSAAAEMRARIFEPAGAENIYLTPEEFPPEDVVNGYGRELMYLAGTVIIGQPDDVGLMINEEPVVDFKRFPQEVLQSSGWTGGGNEAQAESVSAILAAMFDGTILTDDQIAEMTAPTLDVTYGLGISNDLIDGVRVYSHGGGVPGFRSQAGYLPDQDASYAVHASLIPLPEGGGVGDLQRDLVPLLAQAAAVLAG